MKLLLVDDHGMFLKDLRNLPQAGGYQVVAAARNGLEGLHLPRTLHPEVTRMDIKSGASDSLPDAADRRKEVMRSSA